MAETSPQEGRLYLGLVESVAPDGAAQVRVGARVYELPITGERVLAALAR